MKAVIALIAAAAVAAAHPNANHVAHKRAHLARRAVVTEVSTTYETVTKYIDVSTTRYLNGAGADISSSSSSSPSPSSSSSTTEASTSSTDEPSPDAKFFQEESTTSSPTPTPTPVEVKVEEEKTEPPPPPPSPSPEPEVEEAPAAPEPKAAAAAAPVAKSDGGDMQTGDLTYYDIGMGACEIDDSGKDMSIRIAALPQAIMGFGAASAKNPFCGRTIGIMKPDGSGMVEVTVRDKCMGCSPTSIDVSKLAFIDLFGGLEVGRDTVQWKWLS